jgi:hypothetical protein
VNLRPTVSRAPRFFFFLSDSCGVSWRGAPSPTRGWVCNLLVQLLLGLRQSSDSWVKVPQNSRPYFTVSFETPGGPGPCIYILQERGGPVIPLGTRFPFVTSCNSQGCSVSILTRLHGVRHPPGTCDQFFFLFEILFRQLQVCYFVAPSLTRGRVCNLLYNCFWALPEQWLGGSKSRKTHGHILLSPLRLPQPGEPGPHI